MGFIAKLKGFDAHAKPQAHLTKKTAEGGLVSLVGFALMAVLFLAELFAYVAPKRVTTMGVDEPAAGSGIFQSKFSVSLQESGSFVESLRPSLPGPRQVRQSASSRQEKKRI